VGLKFQDFESLWERHSPWFWSLKVTLLMLYLVRRERAISVLEFSEGWILMLPVIMFNQTFEIKRSLKIK
jgi:hypothetical protein